MKIIIIVIIIPILAAILVACGDVQESSSPALPQTSSHISSGPVVFMGDSITQNWGPGVPSLEPVTPTLYQLIPGVIDQGIAGETTVQMLARFQTDVLAYHPSVVVFLGGTNDIRHITDATVDSLAEMASEAAAQGARVIIGTIPGQEGWIPLTRNWNNQIERLAASYGYTVVDYYSVLDPADTPDPAFFQPDGIHPDSAGYTAMWQILQPLLER